MDSEIHSGSNVWSTATVSFVRLYVNIVPEIRWYFGDGQRDPQWEQCVEHSYSELCKAVYEIWCLI